MFKRSLTYVTRNDSDFADQAVSFGQQHEFADLTWYPGQKKVLYRKDNRVSVNVSGNGAYEFIGFRSTATLAIDVNRFTGMYIYVYMINSKFQTTIIRSALQKILIFSNIIEAINLSIFQKRRIFFK